MESVLVKFSIKGLAISLYRPNTHPTLNYNDQTIAFLEQFLELLNFLDSNNLPVLLFGNFNLNLFLSNDPDCNSSTLLNYANIWGYIQTISRATRLTVNNTGTLLDLCFLRNLIPNLIFSGVIVNDISDHYFSLVAIRTEKSRIKPPPPSPRRLFNETTTLAFLNSLSALQWNEVLELNNVDTAYNNFFSMFSEFYNLHFPLVNPSRFNINTTPLNPFMTDSLLRCRIKKEELARIKKNNPSPINILTFNNYRNVYKSTCKTAKKLFYQHSFVNCQGDSKKIWSCLKSTMGLPPQI